MKSIFSSYYLAPIEYYYLLNQSNFIVQDIYENFVKQTYRNRCYILSPNGVQHLSIPLVNVKRKKPFKDIKISYDENWRKIHWKSYEAAYRCSPYFEFYEDEFHPFFHEKKYTFLIDFNELLEEKIIDSLGISINKEKSKEYIEPNMVDTDYRASLSPKKSNLHVYPPYIQVFDDRNEFAPNLSIVDLLFNEGPNSSSYLSTIEINSNV
jgi:hypothetical protein